MAENDDFPLDWEDDDPITAQNNFTDRDDFKKILIDAVEKPQLVTERRVKVFYGAGGQGKSALKNAFFINEYLEKSENKNIIYTDKVDFEYQPKTRMADEALLRITQDLIEKGKVPLPAFCLGFLRYKMQTSAEKNIHQDYPFLYKIKFIENDLANEIFNTIISSSLELIAAGSQMLPGVSFFTKKIADKSHKKIVEWIQKSDAKKVLGDIDELNSLQLLHRLPLLLAYDINKYFKTHIDSENPYPEKRIIIMIDGYEALWHEVKNPDEDKDAWVRILVEKTPGVLFVLFGRDKVRWAEKNEAFEKILDQHLMKGLSDEDANRFLQLSNIEEEEIRKQIIETSKNSKTPEDGCLPFYLDLQVKTYKKIKKTDRMPGLHDFNKNDDDVIKHFFEHLHPDVAGAIKALSLAPYVDEEIIELYVANNFISPNTISLKSLGRHSFIKMDQNRAIIHGLMKDIATKQFQEEFSLRYKKINEILFKYFEDKLPNTQQEINVEIEKLLELGSYHKEIISQKEFIIWAWQKATFYYGKDIYGSLTNILYRALIFFFSEKSNELQKRQITVEDLTINEINTIAEINFYLAGRYNWSDNYKEAEKYVQECLRTIDLASPAEKLKDATENAKNEIIKLLQLRKNAWELYASLLESLDKYVEAGDFYQLAYTLAKDYNFEFDDNAYALYLTNVGKFAEAEPTLFRNYFHWKQEQAKDSGNKNEINEQVALAAHNIAKTLRKQGRYDEAILFHRESIHNYEKSRTTSHEYYAIVKESLAQTLVNQGINLSEAEKIYNEVFEIYRKKYTDDHLYFGYYYVGLGKLYAAKEHSQQAQDFFNKGAQILASKLNPFCKPILESQFELAFLINKLYEQGKIQKETYEIVIKTLVIVLKYNFESFKNIFSIYNPVFQNAIEFTARTLYNEGDNETALVLQQKRNEFIRITNKRTSVRYTHFFHEPVISDKEALINLFRSVISLPEDNSKLELLEITLSFYAGFKLYELTYKNTPLAVHRYILSNKEKTLLLDYTNAPVYEVSETDGNFNAENVFDYITFFFDSVCGRHGFFYAIPDPTDIPWIEDGEVSDEYKNIISSALKPYRILKEDDEKIVAEAFILFKDSLFKSDIVVYKQNIINNETQAIIHYKGNCSLSNEMQCVFQQNGRLLFKNYEGEDGKTIYLDSEGNMVELPANEPVIEEIAACIDPKYIKPDNSNKQRSFHENLIIGLKKCRHYSEFALISTGEEEEEYYKKLHFQANDLLNRVSNKIQCAFSELTDLLSKTISIVKEFEKEFKKSMNLDDWRLINLQNDIIFLQNIITELNNIQEQQKTKDN